MHKGAFIDKDGTIVDNSCYPYRIPSDKLLPNIIDGLKFLQKDHKILLISNQSWIAKKRLTVEQVEKIFLSVVKQLAAQGVEVAGYYYCPHTRKDLCTCRKPAPGMVQQALAEHNLTLSESLVIGDMESDMELGKATGMRSILVRSGCKVDEKSCADVIIDTVDEVVHLWEN